MEIKLNELFITIINKLLKQAIASQQLAAFYVGH